MIEIDKAYSIAQSSASNNDDALEEKKKVIEDRLAAVTKKMKKLKENTVQIQNEVTKMLTETLEELQSIVQQKSNILQSDRHELLRQLHEILFVQEFLRLQAKEADPLEFLQLNNGHAQLKEAIQKTYPKVSTDLFSDATPIILKDRPRLEYNQSNTQLKDTQNLKVGVKNVHDKAVNNLENFRLS